MNRNKVLTKLSNEEFDIVIIGGGIFGACAAWDASLRGLSVALVEQGDFACATSSQHFKMVHGGLRYLQHADIGRMRESIRERRAFFRIASHLIDPLPIVIPTYGWGMKGKHFLGLGMFIYDLIAFDRNKGIRSKQKHIPRGSLLSRDDMLRMFPGINSEGLTGAAMFYDGQMYNSSRVVLSFIKAAAEKGAGVCNYLSVDSFVRSKNCITGVIAKDQITGKSITVRGKVILNTTGPWSQWLLKENLGCEIKPGVNFSRDTCFIIRRKLSDKHALAVLAKNKDPDSIISREGRHLFIVPWREYSLIGVWHVVKKEKPENVTATRAEIESYIEEINDAYPGLNIKYDEITRSNWGLTLFGENEPGKEDLSYGKRSRLIDHLKEDNLEGLISLIGIRATTAGGMGVKAIDMALDKIGKPKISSRTGVTPIWGGDIEDFSIFSKEQLQKCPIELDQGVLTSLLRNYGSKYNEVIKYALEDPRLAEVLDGTNVLKAEIVYAAREEMAQTLIDVVMRRTDLASGENPGNKILEQCAILLGQELGWDAERQMTEIKSVNDSFPNITN